MKKIGLFIIVFLHVLSVFAQHEGMERHFNSYTYDLIEREDNTIFKDTLTDNFHNFLPQQKISYNNLGYMNPGQPFIPAIYSKQPENNVFWFLNNYDAFIKRHNKILYYDARKPFTLFKFNGGMKGLETVKFLHTQNIGSTLNFAFDYDVINSEGHYMYNKAKVHALNFSASYTKRKYEAHLNFIFNKINNNENGGIRDYYDFTSSDLRTNNIPVNLSNSNAVLSQLGFQYSHEYNFGTYTIDTVYEEKDTLINKKLDSKFSIMHDITLDRFYKLYEDNSTDFYQNYYFKDTIGSYDTYDSTSYKYLENKLLLNLHLKSSGKINKFQLLAGLKNRIYYYRYSGYSNTYNSNFITGLLKLETKSSFLYGELNYGLTGREMFDLEAKANFRQNISDFMSFNAYFNFSLTTPYLFFEHYGSTNFKWNNPDLSKTNKTSIGGSLDFNKWKFSVGANINLLHNYFIFNKEALPEQITKANFIADIYLEKLLKVGSFYWFNQLTYQYISDTVNIPLPQFVAYSSLYFKQDLFKNAITVQLGVDMKFHTSIYGYAYMPATGVFYLQDEKRFGAYPNIGVNASIKVKRFRGFVKVSNINSVLNSQLMHRRYFSLYHIPDNPFAVNFGISWEFYN